MGYNKKQHLSDNIEALRTAFELRDRQVQGGAPAAQDELAKLRRYSGFGGLKEVLLPAVDDGDVERWPESARPLFGLVRDLFQLLRGRSRNEEEYRGYVSSMRSSILSAFYTPQPVVQAISAALKKAGIGVATFLDPSAGRGIFVDEFRGAFPEAEVTAYEKDLLTGLVLTAQNPGTDIHVAGYETILDTRRNTFDVAASNIPFGDISVFDPQYTNSGSDANRQASKSIHNYFFLKTLDNVREGGIVAFITSRGVMDSPRNRPIREAMMQRAHLVGAVRLPDGMFTDEAGTDAGSDLIILQKDSNKPAVNISLSPEESAFVDNVSDMEQHGNTLDSIFDEQSDIDWYRSTNPNAYFFLSEYLWQEGPEYIGEKVRGKDMYGKAADLYRWSGTMEELGKTLQDKLDGYMEYDFDRKLYTENAPKPAVSQQTAAGRGRSGREGAAGSKEPKIAPVQLDLFAMWDDGPAGEKKPDLSPRPFAGEILPHWRNGVVVTDGGQVGFLSGVGRSPVFTPVGEKEDLLRAYIAVRDTYQQLYALEAAEHTEQAGLRGRLNSHYDAFVRRFGPLKKRDNMKVIITDVLGRDMLSIENVEDGRFVKSDIFFRPVSFDSNEVEHADTAEEALVASLNRSGGVDLEYMAELSGKEADQLLRELAGKVYMSGDSEYQTAELFLSGNIYAKIDRMENLVARLQARDADEADISLAESGLEALRGVLPRPVTYDELDFNFGERWMPVQNFTEYATELFGVNVTIDYAPNLDEFTIDCDEPFVPKIRDEYAVKGETKDYDGLDLLRHALYDTVPDIKRCVGYKDNGDAIMGPDHEKIQLAASKIDQIRDGFTAWIGRRDPAWKQQMADLYNRKYNCFVRAKFDGSHQTFPGLDLKGLKAKKGVDDIYKSQKDAVWMILQNGGGICDHEVGTGKTLIMCIAAHEMKRLGLARKPIIIGMKANVNEIAATYQAAYPNDRILYAPTESKEFKERDMFFGRMKNNDYDCIIMSHEQFVRIPQSDETMVEVMREEMLALQQALDVYARQKHRYASSKERSGLEKRMENLKAKLADVNYRLSTRADDVVDFKTMGIDHIFVDESQQFKNLPFTTRNNRVSGLGDTQGSQRARNLQYAIRTIQKRTGRDLGATFLSGTTISNSLTELYLLFKYLRPKALAGQDIYSFDAWAAVFARKSRDYEFNVAGQIVMKERFRKFIKVPELAAFYNEITDYKTAADVGLERPKMVASLTNIPPTPDHEDFSRRLLEFASGGGPDLIFREELSANEERAKMLLVTGLGKKASLSPRLVCPDYHEGDDTKVGYAARNIYGYYKRYDAYKGTQFVFCDLSTPKKGEWSVYQELKDRLVGLGIPEKEIYFMQDAGTEKKRTDVIARMNRGEIRVMMGSTTTLGTGVNAQERAVAVHHLDLPWRPSDMEQRNGRAVRKGNLVARDAANNQVDVFVYAVERSLDSYNFYLLQAKSDFIRQLKTGSLGKREFDQGGEDEESGMPFAEYVAITSGNSDLLERAKLEKRILGLESVRKAYYNDLTLSQRKLDYERERLPRLEHYLSDLREDGRVVFGAGFKVDDVLQDVSELGYDDFMLRINPGIREVLGQTKYDEYGARAFRSENRTADMASNSFWLCGDALADFLRDMAHTEVRKETTIGFSDQLCNSGDYQFALTMQSFLKENLKTGVMDFVGNRFYVLPQDLSYERDSDVRYTFNDGKLNLRDKEQRVRYVVDALLQIPALIEQEEKTVEISKNNISELERIVSKPWDKADELKELKEQMQQLDRKIGQTLDAALESRAASPAGIVQPLYKIEKKSYGREPWKLTVKFSDVPFVSDGERDALAERLHGDIHVHGGNVEGSFRHQVGAETAIKEMLRMSREHGDDVEWLVQAVRDVRDHSCLPSVQRLREKGLDRFGNPLPSKDDRTLSVLSLADYADVRDLAHGVKEKSRVPIEIAADAFAKAINVMPGKDRYCLVSMPTTDSYGGYTSHICNIVAEKTGLMYVDVLDGAEHDSLYDFKQQNPGKPLPELFFAMNEDRSLPKGKTPIVIDNVLDTGHTAWAALDALPQPPVILVLGHTGNHLDSVHDIRVTEVTNGLDFVRQSVPAGVGLTGMTQEQIDDLMEQSRSNDFNTYFFAQRELSKVGLDWHTGYPDYLVRQTADKWDSICNSSSLSKVFDDLTGEGGLETIFTEQQRSRLSAHDLQAFAACLDACKEMDADHSYRYSKTRQALVVMYDFLLQKADPAAAEQLMQGLEKPRYEQLLMDDCGIDGDEFREAVGEDPDIVAIVRNTDGLFTDEEIDDKLEDFLADHFYIEPSGIDSGWHKVRTEALAAAREFVTALDKAQQPQQQGEAQAAEAAAVEPAGADVQAREGHQPSADNTKKLSERAVYTEVMPVSSMPVHDAASQMAIVSRRDLDHDEVFLQNHSAEEAAALRYRQGESFEDYLRRNRLQESSLDAKLYFHDKYIPEQWTAIDGILRGCTDKESAWEAGRRIAALDFVGTKKEAYGIQDLLRTVQPFTVMPYLDGVSAWFRENQPNLSLMMKQFYDLKAKHPDAVLLFRCGDFYETYGQDAKTCSDILGITLTWRNSQQAHDFDTYEGAMAGFPHHALDIYLPKLIRAGKRVAICDQLEDPKLRREPVRRGITERVHPEEGVRAQVIDDMADVRRVLPVDAMLRDALIGRMRSAGINVVTDVREARRVLRSHGDAVTFSLTDAVNRQRREAGSHFIKDRNELSQEERETQQKAWRVVFRSLSEIHSSDSSRQAVAPGYTYSTPKPLSGANLGKIFSLEGQVDLLLREINDKDFSKGEFVNVLAGALGMVWSRDKVSRYTEEPIVLGNGDKVTLRVSDHYANCFNFIIEHSNSERNYGLVIRNDSKSRFFKDGAVNYLEINYSGSSVVNASVIQRRDFYGDILKGIQYMLRNGSLEMMPFPDHLNASGVYRKPLQQFRMEHPEMMFHLGSSEDALPALQEELDDIRSSIKNLRRDAEKSYDKFVSGMEGKYGLDWLEKLTDEEREDEHALQEYRELFDTEENDIHEIAFAELDRRHGGVLGQAYGHSDGRLYALFDDEELLFAERIQALQDEYSALAGELPARYEQAKKATEEYRAELVAKYGEDYHGKMTDEEDIRITTLVGEEWKLEPKADGYHTTAFDMMAERHGYDFRLGFGHHDGMLLVSDQVAAEFATGIRMPLDDAQRAAAEQSDSFRNWFGDWQGDPARASKVVGADGRPMVVYHGTGVANAFSVFDRDRAGVSNQLARVGFWFTPSEQLAANWSAEVWHARRGGSHVLPVYLSMRNPKVYRPLSGQAAAELQGVRDRLAALRVEITALIQKYDRLNVDYKDRETFGIACRNGFSSRRSGLDFLSSDNDADRIREHYATRSSLGRESIADGERVYALRQDEARLEDRYALLSHTDSYEQFMMDVYVHAGMRPGDAVVAGLGMCLNDPRKDVDSFREHLMKQGYDGIIIADTKYDRRFAGTEVNTQYVVFEPRQVKSATQNSGLYDVLSPDIRFMYVPDRPVFVSNALLAVDGIRQEKATPEQWLKMIGKFGGLKAGEDRWTGLSDWLQSCQEKTLTKGQVVNYLRENLIRVEDVLYAEMEPFVADTVKISPEFNDMVLGFTEYDEDERPYIDRQRFFEEVKKNNDFYEAFSIDYRGEWIDIDDPVAAARYLGLIEGREINEIRLNYTTAGLDNKKEVALVVPGIERYKPDDLIHFGDAGDGRAVAWVRFGDAFRQHAEEAVEHVDDFEEPYKNYRGYDVYHPLGKTPFDSRIFVVASQLIDGAMEYAVKAKTTGRGDTVTVGTTSTLSQARSLMNGWLADHPVVKFVSEKVLVIDEVQSKRHQDGREIGYKDFSLKGLSVHSYDEKRGVWHIRDIDGNIIRHVFDITTAEAHSESEALQLAAERRYRMQNDIGSMTIPAVPAAPFEKNWHELAMKRMLRYAAENGYDRIAWTTGEQQAERYDIGHIVDAVDVSTYKAQSPNEVDGYDVTILTSDREHNISLFVTKDGIVSTNEHPELHDRHLSEVVGKQLAEKILSEDGGFYQGQDLRVGHEGMKRFYDEMLPGFMNRYCRKWGVRTEDIDFRTNGWALDETWHSIPVTEQMKRDVMEGQPMFLRHNGREVYGFTFGDTIYVNPEIATAETPIHEYTHLWAAVLRDRNPGEWDHIVRLLKGAPELWDSVRARYPHLVSDDAVADEVLAQYSGHRGYEKLMAFAGDSLDGRTVLRRVLEALEKFWHGVADFLHIHYTSKEDVADRVLRDLLSGVNPTDYLHHSVTVGTMLAGRADENIIHDMAVQGVRFDTAVSRRDGCSYLTVGLPYMDDTEQTVDLYYFFPDGGAHKMAVSVAGLVDELNRPENEFTVLDSVVLRHELQVENNDIRFQLGEEPHPAVQQFVEAPRRLTAADREAGGALVDHLQKMGIDVHTDSRENRRVLKEAQKDQSKAGKIRHLKTEAGISYGFSYKGEIHLDLRKIDAELPLHEYAHLWCEAMRRINPGNWKAVVDVMKNDAGTWQYVSKVYPELKDDDDLAEEVIARYSGKRGAGKLQAELQRMSQRDDSYQGKWGNIFQNVSKAIQDFWKYVGDSLNIQYTSKDDIADQILNDFARKVSPVRKVEKWLHERDRAYADSAENDPDLAARLFEEALQENIGSGVTPVMAVDGYRGRLDQLARSVKEEDNTEAVNKAADMMAPLVPPYSVLIPAPGHEGRATHTLALANAIAARTGSEVRDVLVSDPRESQYEHKKATGKPLSADALGIRLAGKLPANRLPVVIDNVIHSGNTAEACVKALGRGVVLSLSSAVGQNRHVASLKSLAPILYDRDGRLVPLSERFNLHSRYLGDIYGDALDIIRRDVALPVLPDGMYAAEADILAIRAAMPSLAGEFLGSPSLMERVWDIQCAGDYVIAGYEDYESGDYVFVGRSAELLQRLLPASVAGVTVVRQEDCRSMPVVRIPQKDADGKPVYITDTVYPKLVAKGYSTAVLGADSVRGLVMRDRKQEEKPAVQEAEQATRPASRYRSAVQLNLFDGQPVTEEPAERPLSAYSDDELLAEVSKVRYGYLPSGGAFFSSQAVYANRFMEEYDRRHQEDYETAVNRYSDYMDQETFNGRDTGLQALYDMYSDVVDKLRAGAFATPERIELMAQVGVLEELVHDREYDFVVEHEDRLSEQFEEVLSQIESRESEDTPAYNALVHKLEQQYEQAKAAIREYRVPADLTMPVLDEVEVQHHDNATCQSDDESARRRFEEQKSEAHALGYDLTQLHLRELEDGETCYVERRYTESKAFSFTGSEHIETPADVAQIFRKLEDQAVENSFLVFVKDGVPTVVHLAIGSYNETLAPIEKALMAARELRPEKVWFVHNHPSGSLKVSTPDLGLQHRVEMVFGEAAQPGIIINTTSGKYVEYNNDMSKELSFGGKSSDEGTAVRVFQFDRSVFDKDWNPEKAFKATTAGVAGFVSSHRLGVREKMSLLVIDQMSHITGNIFLPWTDVSQLQKRENIALLASYVNQMGGNGCVLYGSDGAYSALKGKLLSSLSKELKLFGVRLADVVSTTHSAYIEGLLVAEAQDRAFVREDEASSLSDGEQRFLDIAAADLETGNHLLGRPRPDGYRELLAEVGQALGAVSSGSLTARQRVLLVGLSRYYQDGLQSVSALAGVDGELLSDALRNAGQPAVSRSIAGLEDYTEQEICKYVREHFEAMLEGTGIDAEIVDMKVIGSRVNGDSDEHSDLDVLLEFRGSAREDSLFNILNDKEDRLYIEGIPVDINPITEGKSGTIRDFLERNAGYKKAVDMAVHEETNQYKDMKIVYSIKEKDGGYIVNFNEQPFLHIEAPELGRLALAYSPDSRSGESTTRFWLPDYGTAEQFAEQAVLQERLRGVRLSLDSRDTDTNIAFIHMSHVLEAALQCRHDNDLAEDLLRLSEGDRSLLKGESLQDYLKDKFSQLSDGQHPKLRDEWNMLEELSGRHLREMCWCMAYGLPEAKVRQLVPALYANGLVLTQEDLDAKVAVLKDFTGQLDIDYMPFGLKQDVLVTVEDDMGEPQEKTFRFAAVEGDDIVLYESMLDTYGGSNGLVSGTPLDELPSLARMEVLDSMLATLGDDTNNLVLVEDRNQVPGYALGAIVNGDFSGIEDEKDEQVIREYIDRHPGCHFDFDYDTLGFVSSPAFGKATDCVTLFAFRTTTVGEQRERVQEEQQLVRAELDAVEDCEKRLTDVIGERFGDEQFELNFNIPLDIQEPDGTTVQANGLTRQTVDGVSGLYVELNRDEFRPLHDFGHYDEVRCRLLAELTLDVLNGGRDGGERTVLFDDVPGSLLKDSFVSVSVGDDCELSVVRREMKDGELVETTLKGQDLVNNIRLTSLEQILDETEEAVRQGLVRSTPQPVQEQVKPYTISYGSWPGLSAIAGDIHVDFADNINAVGFREIREMALELGGDARAYDGHTWGDFSRMADAELFAMRVASLNQERIGEIKATLAVRFPELDAGTGQQEYASDPRLSAEELLDLYEEVKGSHPDNVILLRHDGVVETFGEDAITLASAVGVEPEPRYSVDGEHMYVHVTVSVSKFNEMTDDFDFNVRILDANDRNLSLAAGVSLAADAKDMSREEQIANHDSKVAALKDKAVGLFGEDNHINLLDYDEVARVGIGDMPDTITVDAVDIKEGELLLKSDDLNDDIPLDNLSDVEIDNISAMFDELHDAYEKAPEKEDEHQDHTLFPSGPRQASEDLGQDAGREDGHAGQSAVEHRGIRAEVAELNDALQEVRAIVGDVIPVIPVRVDLGEGSETISFIRAVRDDFLNDHTGHSILHGISDKKDIARVIETVRASVRDQQEADRETAAKEVAGQKREAGQASRSEEQQKRQQKGADPTQRIAIQTALLVSALAGSKDSQGVWLNAGCRNAPFFLPGTHLVMNPFNQVMMSLHADAGGYATGGYVTYEAALKDGFSVRQGERSTLFVQVDREERFENRLTGEQLGREQYDALPEELKDLYRAVFSRQPQAVFNIDQTNMADERAGDYEHYCDHAVNEGALACPADAEEVIAGLKEKYPDSLVAVLQGDSYELHGQDAVTAGMLFGMDIRNVTDGQGNIIEPAVWKFDKSMLDKYLPRIVDGGHKVCLVDGWFESLKSNIVVRKAYDGIEHYARAMMAAGMKVAYNSVVTTGYDRVTGQLNINSDRRSSYGESVSTAVARVSDASRAMAAALMLPQHLNITGRTGILPSDEDRYRRLVQEVATGTVMSRMGLPASLSEDNRRLVPYWIRELQNNPGLIVDLENDVNSVVAVLDKITAGEQVDFAHCRHSGYSTPTAKQYSISELLATYPDAASGTVVLVADADKKDVRVIVPDDDGGKGIDRNGILLPLDRAGYGHVSFYTAGGRLGLSEPNDFYADKVVTLQRYQTAVTDGRTEYMLKPMQQLGLAGEIAHSRQADITLVDLIPGDNRKALLVMSDEGKAVTVYPTNVDAQLVESLKCSREDARSQEILERIGRKYYDMVVEHPELERDLLTPKGVEIDMNQFSRVSIARDGQSPGKFLVYAEIGGERQEPVSIDSFQAERFWLVGDRDMHKMLMLSELFRDKFGIASVQEHVRPPVPKEQAARQQALAETASRKAGSEPVQQEVHPRGFRL